MMCMHSRDYAFARCLFVCLSVCLSVTCQYFVEMAKCHQTFFTVQ